MIIDKSALLKSIIYRFFASFVTFVISFIFTGSITISSLIGVCEFIGKIFCFYVFEVGWKFITGRLDEKTYRQTCFRFNKRGTVIWLTGLNCTGKTSIGKELTKMIPNSVLLDGDAIRQTINRDLKFSRYDITQNISRISDIAEILKDQGKNVVVACISKYFTDRKMVKNKIGAGYHEVHLVTDDTTINDRLKKLHKNTPIIQTNYEESDYEVLTIDTTNTEAKDVAERIICSFQD